MPSNPDQLKSLVHTFFDQAWTRGNIAIIDQLVASDTILHGLAPEPITGRENYKKWYTQFRSAFSDIACPITHCLVEGDWTAFRIRFTARHTGSSLGPPASGQPVLITPLILVRWHNGQVAEAYNEFDQLSLMRQINALPLPSYLSSSPPNPQSQLQSQSQSQS